MSSNRQDKIADCSGLKKIGFFADERGAAAIEYAIIAGSLSIVIALSVTNVGTAVANLFADVAAAF